MPVAVRAGGVLSIIVVCVCALAVLAGPASASLPSCSAESFTDREDCRFGEEGDGPGQFRGAPTSVAVNQSTGDVFVLDFEHSSVEEFTGQGVFVRSFGQEQLARPRLLGGLAVDSASGDVYVVDQFHGRVVKFDSEGRFLLEFVGGGSVAVGPSGTVYVGEFGAVQEYDSAGHVGVRLELEGAESISDLAVNNEGEIYVSEGEFEGFGAMHPVRGYSKAGVLLGVFDEASEGQARSLTLDPASGEVFANEGFSLSAGVQIRGFTPVGVQLSAFASTTGEFREGVAFDEKTGALYTPAGEAGVASSEYVSVSFPPAPGPVVFGESVGSMEPTAALVHASVNPEAGEEADTTSYRVEYGTSTSYGSSAPLPEGTLPGSFNNEAVEVLLTGLQPRTEYHYRVLAGDECVKEEVRQLCTSEGEDETFTTLPPALVEEEFVSDVRSSSVTLHASVNPLGSATTYHFLYGPCESGECAILTPDEPIGSGKTPVQVEQHLQGLTAGQTYHYHLVATNPLGTTIGQEHSFTTQTGGETGLPDSREWELVSPPDKHGAHPIGIQENNYLQAAATGGGIVYSASAPTESQPHGNGEFIQVLARRTSSAWSNLDLTIPHSFPTGTDDEDPYHAFSSDLTLGALQPGGSFEPALSKEATEQGPYLRNNNTSLFTPLVTPTNDNTGLPFGEEASEEECKKIVCGPEVRGATPDLSHIVLEPGHNGHGNPLLAGTTGGLYDWSAGKLTWVSELPPNPPEIGGQPTLGGVSASYEVLTHAVSNDGSRVFWTQPALSKAPMLFMRDTTRGETIEIGSIGANFEGANAQGTLVFYSGKECAILTGKTGLECQPVLGEHGEELEDGTILATSEDGTWVYFQKQASIYVRHSNAPAKQIATNIGHIRPPTTVQGLAPQEDPWRASPNGEWFAFMSDSPLTGYDNHDATTGQPDEEIYLYSATSERLVCASCNPTGARPHGALAGHHLLAEYAVHWGEQSGVWIAATVPGWAPYANLHALYDPRFLSDAGRLFFNAVGGLVPRDVNGQVDTYELEPPGVGDCTTATQTGTVVYSSAADGCVALISGGESPEESVFEDASESGDDVFFLSSSRLSTLDLDGSLSLWDGHACVAASPCLPTPVARPPACDTEASCKVAPSSQPAIFGAPASATFVGAGNAVSSGPAVSKVAKHRTLACKRGLTKRKGRCVVRHERKKKRHRGKVK